MSADPAISELTEAAHCVLAWIDRSVDTGRLAAERLERALAGVKESASGWHPVSELPPDERCVLVAGDGFIGVAFRMGDDWFEAIGDTSDGERPFPELVEHWHELPEDPPNV